MFSADAHADQVTIIDSETLEVETTVPVGGYPSGLTHVPETRRLYVGNSLGSTMSVIDLDTLETVATVDAEPGAGAIGVDPTRHLAVCVNFVAASANFFDAESFEEVGRLELGIGTCAIGIVPERGEAFIVNSIAGTVSRVDLDKHEIVEEIRTGQAPVGLTVAPVARPPLRHEPRRRLGQRDRRRGRSRSGRRSRSATARAASSSIRTTGGSSSPTPGARRCRSSRTSSPLGRPAPVIDEPSPWIGKQAAELLPRGLLDGRAAARTPTGPRRSTSSTSSPAGEDRATRRRRSSRNCASREEARSGVEIVLVDIWEGTEPRPEVERFCEMWGIKGPILLDPGATLARELGVRGVPTNVARRLRRDDPRLRRCAARRARAGDRRALRPGLERGRELAAFALVANADDRAGHGRLREHEVECSPSHAASPAGA